MPDSAHPTICERPGVSRPQATPFPPANARYTGSPSGIQQICRGESDLGMGRVALKMHEVPLRHLDKIRFIRHKDGFSEDAIRRVRRDDPCLGWSHPG